MFNIWISIHHFQKIKYGNEPWLKSLAKLGKVFSSAHKRVDVAQYNRSKHPMTFNFEKCTSNK